MARKIAVVLFNLGGPDGPDDVQPFLRNLFRDPAIIGAPKAIREALAWFISKTRAPSARKNYELMGGGSPLLPESEKQADALIAELRKSRPEDEFRTFIAMRYWHPFVSEAVEAVKNWAADEIVLLPFIRNIRPRRRAHRSPDGKRRMVPRPARSVAIRKNPLSFRRMPTSFGRPGLKPVRRNLCACCFLLMACRNALLHRAIHINGRSNRHLPLWQGNCRR
jgi:hypothetical protein